MTEFNLSEKLRKPYKWDKGVFAFDDIKEFIKICEKECCSVCEKVIKQHAGPKLL